MSTDRNYDNITLYSGVVESNGYSDPVSLGQFDRMMLFAEAITDKRDAAEVEIELVATGFEGVKTTYLLGLGGATGGTFDLGIEDDMQVGLAYNISAANLQTELRKIVGTGWDAVTVAADEADYIITLPLALEQPEMVADFTDLTGATGPSFVVGDEFEEAVDEVHKYRVRYAGGGTFTLSYGTDTTGTIAYNAAGATLEAALVAAVTEFTDELVTVAKDTGTGWYTVTFDSSLDEVGLPDAAPESLTITDSTLKIELEIKNPVTNQWYNLKQKEYYSEEEAGEGEVTYTVAKMREVDWFATWEDDGNQLAEVEGFGDELRLKFTVAGSGPLVGLIVAATAKER